MVISVLMKDICEHLGIIRVDLSKNPNNEDKIYILNQERVDVYNRRQNELLELIKKFDLSSD